MSWLRKRATDALGAGEKAEAGQVERSDADGHHLPCVSLQKREACRALFHDEQIIFDCWERVLAEDGELARLVAIPVCSPPSQLSSC